MSIMVVHISWRNVIKKAQKDQEDKKGDYCFGGNCMYMCFLVLYLSGSFEGGTVMV